MRMGKAPPSPWFISPLGSSHGGYRNGHSQPAGTRVSDTVYLGATSIAPKTSSMWLVGIALGLAGGMLLITGLTAAVSPGHRR